MAGCEYIYTIPDVAHVAFICRYWMFMSDRSGDVPVPPDAGGVGIRVSLM